MISGNKKDIAKIQPYLEAKLQKALQYLAETDFTDLPKGEYAIDGRDIFARVDSYTTEAKEAKRPESHDRYIDVQYLAAGSETIWYCPKTPMHSIVEDLRAAADLIFYADAGEKDCVHLTGGDFAVFFPWELHRPGCVCGSAISRVKKIVVKVKADRVTP